MRGKSIDLYLMNGTADSLVRARLSNWNGEAYRIPKVEVKNCTISEMHMPGVYFLFGKNDNELTCYVGESDDTLKRLKQHLDDDNDWNTAVMFLGTELDATKILCLENECFSKLKDYNRCKLVTQQTNNHLHISDESKDIAMEYMENMRIILPALGYNVLEPVVNSFNKKSTLFIDVTNGQASGIETAEGFVILSGSKVNGTISASMPASASIKRNDLESKGIISNNVFTADYQFNSSSEAAAVVLGYAVSGPAKWHYSDGTTLKKANQDAANADLDSN